MKLLIAALLMTGLMAMASPAMAQMRPTGQDQTELIATTPYALTPSDTKGPFYYQSENELRMRKFSRGLANIVLSPAEIPNQMFQEAYRTSPVTGIVVGAFKGVWKGVKRIGIGAWEVATFYHPTANHYQPYIQPEVVFQEYLH